MRKARVLIAHRQIELSRRFAFIAEKATPCEIRTFSNGYEILEAAECWLPDLLILDRELVGLDGISLCYRLRKIPQFSDTPILVAIPADRRDERYRAYQVGADEILSPPFDDLELTFRLRVHLRRRHLVEEPLTLGAIRLEPHTHTAHVENKALELTPSEYAILSILLQKADHPVPTETLLVEALGAAPQLGNPQVVHTHIRNLRRKLESDPAHPEYLRSVRRGYQWFSPAP